MVLSYFCVSVLLSCIGASSCLENSKDVPINQRFESVNFVSIGQQEEKIDSAYYSPSNVVVLLPFGWTPNSKITNDVGGVPVSNPPKPQNAFGSSREVDNHEIYEAKKIHKSNWTIGNMTYRKYLVDQYFTYSFEHFVDIPVKNIVTPENVPPHEVATYKLELTSKYEMNYSELSSAASNYSSSFSKELGVDVGSSIPISDILKMSAGVSDKTKIKFSQSFKEKMERSTSSSSSFEKKIVRTFVYDNSINDDYVKFTPCLRQRFEVYCTDRYHFDYNEKPGNSGLFGFDETWTYIQKAPVKTSTYFFVPVGSMYFEVSKYTSDSNGADKNLRPMSNNTLFL